jgi:hypothetical protein
VKDLSKNYTNVYVKTYKGAVLSAAVAAILPELL